MAGRFLHWLCLVKEKKKKKVRGAKGKVVLDSVAGLQLSGWTHALRGTRRGSILASAKRV